MQFCRIARNLLQAFWVGKIFGGLLVEQGPKLLPCCGCSHFVCAHNLLRPQFPAVHVFVRARVPAPRPQLPPARSASVVSEGKKMTDSAWLRRAVGRLSGISRLSFRTSARCSRRSAALLVVAGATDERAKGAMLSVVITFFIRRVL